MLAAFFSIHAYDLSRITYRVRDHEFKREIRCIGAFNSINELLAVYPVLSLFVLIFFRNYLSERR